MKPKLKRVMIVVMADPRKSGRAAEAVRIAAGVGGWEKVAVTLCLAGEARRVLGETVDDLVNGEVFESYLPLLVDGEARLYVLDSGRKLKVKRDGRYEQISEVGVKVLAEMCRETEMVLRF